jgi:predicted ATPase
MHWLLGYPDQALRRNEEALALAQELARPFEMVFALWHAVTLHFERGDWELLQARSDALVAAASAEGVPQFLARGLTLRGWLLIEQGHSMEGLAQVREGMATFLAATRGRERSHFDAVLADACRKVGQVEEGLAVVDEVLERASTGGEGFYQAELYRLKGELLLKRPAPPEQQAEQCFQEALTAARNRNMRSLELRAAMTLARLWQRQGKHAEARQLLADTYGWFTEGFDTRDLRVARAVLEELS